MLWAKSIAIIIEVSNISLYLSFLFSFYLFIFFYLFFIFFIFFFYLFISLPYWDLLDSSPFYLYFLTERKERKKERKCEINE